MEHPPSHQTLDSLTGFPSTLCMINLCQFYGPISKFIVSSIALRLSPSSTTTDYPSYDMNTATKTCWNSNCLHCCRVSKPSGVPLDSTSTSRSRPVTGRTLLRTANWKTKRGKWSHCCTQTNPSVRSVAQK